MTQSKTISLKTALGEARRMAHEIGGDEIGLAEKAADWTPGRTEQTIIWLMYVMNNSEEWTIGKLADAGFDLSLLKPLQVIEMREGENLIDYIYRLCSNSQAQNAFAAGATMRLFERMEHGDLDLECAGDDMVSVLSISILNGYKFDAQVEFDLYKKWIENKEGKVVK